VEKCVCICNHDLVRTSSVLFQFCTFAFSHACALYVFSALFLIRSEFILCVLHVSLKSDIEQVFNVDYGRSPARHNEVEVISLRLRSDGHKKYRRHLFSKVSVFLRVCMACGVLMCYVCSV
jgi:hypothetical protein